MKACILQHKMLAFREIYEVVICPRNQQVKKKKGFFFFSVRINLNIFLLQFSPNMKWIKISDMLVEVLFLSYIILI